MRLFEAIRWRELFELNLVVHIVLINKYLTEMARQVGPLGHPSNERRTIDHFGRWLGFDYHRNEGFR